MMRNHLLQLTLILTILVSLTFITKAQNKKGFTPLFNGENFDGWYLKIRSGDEDKAKEVYAIEDGMVHVYKHMADSADLGTNENSTHGLFFTKKKYSKFIFRFEYKWGTKITNNFNDWQYDAGCYYHVFDDKIWPDGIEYQIRYNHETETNHTGDLIISGVKLKWSADKDDKFCLPKDGGTSKSYDEWMYKAGDNVQFNALNNEWNQCEIIVMADQYVIHKLNGTIVNIGTDLSVSEGIIGLQSETAEIYYRNIEIKEFDKIIPMKKFLQKK